MDDVGIEFLKRLVKCGGRCRAVRLEYYDGKPPPPFGCGKYRNKNDCPIVIHMKERNRNRGGCTSDAILTAATEILRKHKEGCINSIW